MKVRAPSEITRSRTLGYILISTLILGVGYNITQTLNKKAEVSAEHNGSTANGFPIVFKSSQLSDQKIESDLKDFRDYGIFKAVEGPKNSLLHSTILFSVLKEKFLLRKEDS